MLAAVDAGELFEVVWVSAVAGIAITVAYSFVVLGTARSAEARRSGQTRTAVAFGTLAALCFLLFVGGVALGVQIMLSKG